MRLVRLKRCAVTWCGKPLYGTEPFQHPYPRPSGVAFGGSLGRAATSASSIGHISKAAAPRQRQSPERETAEGRVFNKDVDLSTGV